MDSASKIVTARSAISSRFPAGTRFLVSRNGKNQVVFTPILVDNKDKDILVKNSSSSTNVFKQDKPVQVKHEQDKPALVNQDNPTQFKSPVERESAMNSNVSDMWGHHNYANSSNSNDGFEEGFDLFSEINSLQSQLPPDSELAAIQSPQAVKVEPVEEVDPKMAALSASDMDIDSILEQLARDVKANNKNVQDDDTTTAESAAAEEQEEMVMVEHNRPPEVVEDEVPTVVTETAPPAAELTAAQESTRPKRGKRVMKRSRPVEEEEEMDADPDFDAGAKNGKKIKLYQQRSFKDPKMEKARQNAINAKRNRDRKKREREALESQMDLLRSELERVTEERDRLSEDLSFARSVLREHGLAHLLNRRGVAN